MRSLSLPALQVFELLVPDSPSSPIHTKTQDTLEVCATFFDLFLRHAKKAMLFQ
jgi:hypothetical protein